MSSSFGVKLRADLLRDNRNIKSLRKCGYNRSVMPFDVLGCTRVTMIMTESIYVEKHG